MNTEKIFEELENTFDGILGDYDAGIGPRVNEKENGIYSIRLYMNGGLDGLDCEFNIDFNGTKEDFIKQTIGALYSFDAGDCARENIENYDITDAEDMKWYIEKSEALKNQCESLAEELEEYEENNKRKEA